MIPLARALSGLDESSRLALEYRAGRPGALERLYRAVAPQLGPALVHYRPGRAGLPGTLDPDDLRQQSWVILAELARHWRPDAGSFGAYVRASFGWALAGYVRLHSGARRARNVAVFSVPHQQAFDLLDARVGVDGDTWADRLACCELLAKLPVAERKALLLQQVEDRPLAEVAARLGVSTSTVYRLVRRARRRAHAWQRGEPLPAIAPLRTDSELERLVAALHRGVRPDGSLPGRAWSCAETGLSQPRYATLMRRLVASGCLEGRSARKPGRLVDLDPQTTLRRVLLAPPA